MEARSRGSAVRFLRRGWNALRRLRSGLRLVAESVSPEVRNDLFVAHLAVYSFFARFVTGKRVLDLGCGTGYGSRHLLESGAAAVVGVDADRKAIRYARRRFAGDGLAFRVEDAEELPASLGRFEVVVSSNVLEHLERPERALDAAARLLPQDGLLLAAVPPIVDDGTLRENQRNPFHRSNLYLWQWHDLLAQRFSMVTAHRQDFVAAGSLDFADPFPSRRTVDDFAFPQVPLDELRRAPALGVVLVCEEPSAG
jgi:SAM-dependent methyltransferase